MLHKVVNISHVLHICNLSCGCMWVVCVAHETFMKNGKNDSIYNYVNVMIYVFAINTICFCGLTYDRLIVPTVLPNRKTKIKLKKQYKSAHFCIVFLA